LADQTVVAWGCPCDGGDINRPRNQERIPQVTEIQSSRGGAFAALATDGRIVAWGNPSAGGAFPAAWSKKAARAIQGNRSGFAALLCDDTIISWGCEHLVHGEPKLNQPFFSIATTAHAFAAVTMNGDIVAWGSPEHGGDASAVQDDLHDVEEIAGSSSAFVAITKQGMFLTWGNAAAAAQGKQVQNFFCCETTGAFV
jgi:alpha-tubulin suppressor-like RCC1 family protein